MEDFSVSLEKALNVLLPRKFPFIEGVSDVIAIKEKFKRNIKFKIHLNKKWVYKNFSKELLEYISDEIKKYGHVLLAPFVVGNMWGGGIDYPEVEEYINDILHIMGFGLGTATYFDVAFKIV